MNKFQDKVTVPFTVHMVTRSRTVGGEGNFFFLSGEGDV